MADGQLRDVERLFVVGWIVLRCRPSRESYTEPKRGRKPDGRVVVHTLSIESDIYCALSVAPQKCRRS
ncbi:hypothetical protein MRX96_044980 [Rhipicephalus microplus]